MTSGSLLVAIPIALLAGLISFLSPCLLPLAPGNVSYVSGALMVAVGVLLVSGAWTDVTVWMRVQSDSFQPPL